MSEVSVCVNTVVGWTRFDRLQLNASKTDFLLCKTGRRQHQLPSTGPTIDSVHVTRALTKRGLGVFVGSDVVMRSHVQQTLSSCFAALRQLRSIQHGVLPSVFQSHVIALL
jgi:hypothetical protein